MAKEFFNIDELSEYLGIKVSTIYALVERKGIPHYKVGRLVRFKKSEVDEWMEAQKEPAVHTKIEARRIIAPSQKKPDRAINEIVKKAIDGARKKAYTSPHGKPDQSKGLGKEVEHGSI